MSVEDTVRQCIENSEIHPIGGADYSFEEYEDNENSVIVHTHAGFLTSDLSERLRDRLIFVDATSASDRDDYSEMYFLHYLEPEEDTFMDDLAEPVSTQNSIEAVTREIAETRIDESNSHRYNLGFISALNFVRKRTSKDGEWTGLLSELPNLQDVKSTEIEEGGGEASDES